jgi:sugar lactone lactonase YvrE
MLGHYAGNGLNGLVDGPAGTFTATEFTNPIGLAADAQGNVFVADSYNNRIRKIDASGRTTTFAGNGLTNEQDGTGGPNGTAEFSRPTGLVLDGQGNLFVSDNWYPAIRKVDPAGNVTTFAGNHATGHVDGPATTAEFQSPCGMAIDALGNLYVADGQWIRKIDPSGNVSTVAGDGNGGYVDGPAATAEFNNPQGVAVDAQGNLYVGDTANNRIREIDTTGNVTTLAGNGTGGYADGTGGANGTAEFYSPYGLATDASGNLWVADNNNGVIRSVSPNGDVTTVVGSHARIGDQDGAANTAGLSTPIALAFDSQGDLFFTESASVVRKVDTSGTVSTLGGNGNGGYFDGTHDHDGSAEFYFPYATAFDSQGNLYVADQGNNSVRKIDPLGTTTTPINHTANGPGGALIPLGQPSGIAVDAQDNVYVSDSDQSTILKMDTAGNVSVLAGGNSSSHFADGQGAAAGFYYPSGLAVDGAGNVLVVDSFNCAIRKVDPSGNVTTVAGTGGTCGYQDGPSSSAQFRFSLGNELVLDAQGNIYVADQDNHVIRKVDTAGNVTTFSGTGSAGSSDGTNSTATYFNPSGMAMDAQGNFYISDIFINVIRKIDTAGNVTTIAGNSYGFRGYADGPALSGMLNQPIGLAVDAQGTLYVADSSNNAIRTLTFVP